MLQHIYWGKHVWRDDDFAAAQSLPEWAAFDLTTTTTPQEYSGWGAGLFIEPSLKITFPDGNRDLSPQCRFRFARQNYCSAAATSPANFRMPRSSGPIRRSKLQSAPSWRSNAGLPGAVQIRQTKPGAPLFILLRRSP